jgi:hypothetical protein
VHEPDRDGVPVSAAATYGAVYHRVDRMWYLWNGSEAVLDGGGKLRLFLTAAAAYEWLERQA